MSCTDSILAAVEHPSKDSSVLQAGLLERALAQPPEFPLFQLKSQYTALPFAGTIPQPARGQPHSALWQHLGASCSQRQVFLPCDVSDIEAGVTPCVQGLQELPLELGIFCHIIFHQVSFILEQQWSTHLGEGIMVKHRALPLIPMEHESPNPAQATSAAYRSAVTFVTQIVTQKASVQQTTDLCLSDEHSQGLL